MKTTLIISLFCLAYLVPSCKKDNYVPAEVKQIQLTEKQKQIVDHSNTFGFDFFRQIHEASGSEHNLMVSPLSVSMALGMTRNGAAGSTLEAMTSALGLSGLSEQEINESYKYILETFSSLDPKVKVAIANSIWYRNTFKVEQEFIATNQEYFNAQVNPLDFSDPKSVTTINNWVSDNTNKLIPKIIDGISDDMVMYLINAVYFKGQWKYQFESKNSVDKPFTLTDGTVVQARSMNQRASLNYFTAENFKAVELPYNQGNYNMTVILPNEGTSLDDVIGQLNMDNWIQWQRASVVADIQLQLPKFKFSYDEQKMKEVLGNMGMSVAFDPYEADFTRINKEGGIFISEVKHKTFIETNEEGTEAAAVTSVGMETTSVGVDPEPISFTVDKPFAFLITEKSTGTILFIGTIMNPLKEE